MHKYPNIYWDLSKMVMAFFSWFSDAEKRSSVLLIFYKLCIYCALFLISRIVNYCFFLLASTSDLTKLFFFVFPFYQQPLKTNIIFIMVYFWFLSNMLMKIFLVLTFLNFSCVFLTLNFLIMSLMFFLTWIWWYFCRSKIDLPFLSSKSFSFLIKSFFFILHIWKNFCR